MVLFRETHIEIINPHIKSGHIRHALFDFDGTISLIREGWQDVMIPMMVEVLMELETRETAEELTALVTEFVARLTGKQTIYQMIQLCDEVRSRGGEPLDPLEYKWMYLDRLGKRIEGRIAALKEDRATPEEMVVPGSLDMLEAIRAQGITCYLASGTDEPFVKEEADLLGVTSYFDGVYGALDDYKTYSKKMVVERIIAENNLSGEEFVAFGDGYVEIENVKAVGGISVGVASSEATRLGIDEWKRHRLIQAGADIIIPDFREYQQLITYLCVEV